MCLFANFKNCILNFKFFLKLFRKYSAEQKTNSQSGELCLKIKAVLFVVKICNFFCRKRDEKVGDDKKDFKVYILICVMLWMEGMWSVQVHIDQNKLCPSRLTTTNSIMHIASSSFAASQLHLLIYFTTFFVAKRTQKELWMMKKKKEKEKVKSLVSFYLFLFWMLMMLCLQHQPLCQCWADDGWHFNILK